MTRYVVGSIEPFYINGNETCQYVKFPDNNVGHPSFNDIEDATFFNTKKEAEKMADIYYEEDDGSEYFEDYDELFRDELCVYEVDVKVKVKKQFK